MRLPPALLATLALASLAIAQNQYQKDVIALNPIGSWPLTGNANDVSGNGNNGSLINGVNFTSQNPSPIEAQNAIMLSGVDQYVSIPPSASFNLDNHHAMTAIVWVKTTNQGLPFEFVMGKASAGTGWVLGIDNGTLPGSGRFGLF
ncbi:MAG TPA: hypothetical protein VKS01_10640, partial [Bryobacteraceae bacterium]|nr:hypothetical protein [Bryobacteraceae bacterium]